MAVVILAALLLFACNDSHIVQPGTKPTGDLNENGVPFEIADWILFQKYLVEGAGALPVGTAYGLADINFDGDPFTVADLVCFKRIMDGDAFPRQKFPSDSIEVSYEVGELLYIAQPVGAIRLVLEGAASVVLLPEFAEMHYAQRDGKTYVLVTPRTEDIGGELSGQVLYLDHAPILEIQMALPNGAPAKPKSNMPASFYLGDNFPNPFDASTTITFDLATRSQWHLEIGNFYGEIVDEYSGFSEAGRVEIIWDPGDLPYGVYFYRLTVGNETFTKTMSYVGPVR